MKSCTPADVRRVADIIRGQTERSDFDIDGVPYRVVYLKPLGRRSFVNPCTWCPLDQSTPPCRGAGGSPCHASSSLLHGGVRAVVPVTQAAVLMVKGDLV